MLKRLYFWTHLKWLSWTSHHLIRQIKSQAFSPHTSNDRNKGLCSSQAPHGKSFESTRMNPVHTTPCASCMHTTASSRDPAAWTQPSKLSSKPFPIKSTITSQWHAGDAFTLELPPAQLWSSKSQYRVMKWARWQRHWLVLDLMVTRVLRNIPDLPFPRLLSFALRRLWTRGYRTKLWNCSHWPGPNSFLEVWLQIWPISNASPPAISMVVPLWALNFWHCNLSFSLGPKKFLCQQRFYRFIAQGRRTF